MENGTKNNSSKKVIIIAIIIVALMAMVYLIAGPKGQSGEKNITVTVDHIEGDDTAFEISTDEEYLRGALEDEGLISGSESEYGLFIETVDGETADASQEQWWGYSINGDFAENGVDTQPIEDGAEYEFVLNEGYSF